MLFRSFSDYERHLSDIKMTVCKILQKAEKALPKKEMPVAITGSGGLLLSKLLRLDFVQEVIATKTCVKTLLPSTDVAIELGGEDAKILFFTGATEQRMNGTCAGGTGAFIDQMSILLKTDAKGLDELASRHSELYPIAARCGVFAKSDVQPLLNEGAAKEDIAASIFQSVVTQTISGLAQGRTIKGNILFLGGPLHFLPQLRRQFEETLSVNGNTFTHPENSQLFVAMGAAMSAKGEAFSVSQLLKMLDESNSLETEIARIRPIFENDDEFKDFYNRHSKNVVGRSCLKDASGELFLGLDRKSVV